MAVTAAGYSQPMKQHLTHGLTYAAVVPLYALSAAGWVVIVGAAVVSNLVAGHAEEVPYVAPKDHERAVA